MIHVARTICLAALWLASAAVPAAGDRFEPPPCETGQLQVMVLGTYHMSNPGLDAVNMEADDVLSNRRQAEIADLVGRLARFAPDKVLIEAPYGSSVAPTQYAAYLRDAYEPGRNEIDQVGYRLARRLGHDSVYPVDYPMFQDSVALEFYTARFPDAEKESDAVRARWAPAIEADNERLANSTVADYLHHLNGTDWWGFDLDSRFVLETSIRYAAYDQYAGADMLTSWYKRNLRILTNLHRSVGADDKRVLLLFGAGHNRILWDLIDTSPLLCRVDPRPYLRD